MIRLMTQRLLTIDEAAAELGVPKGSLRNAAERHGFLVRMGRAYRIDPETLPELIERCRENPQAHASTFTPRGSFTTSATEPNSSQRALEAAEKLKQHSRGTSPKGTGRPAAQLHRIK